MAPASLTLMSRKGAKAPRSKEGKKKREQIRRRAGPASDDLIDCLLFASWRLCAFA
jgi:hypothetical protein